MNSRSLLHLGCALSLPLLLTQCAKDPSEDVDAAKVGEVSKETAPEPEEEISPPAVYVFSEDSTIGFVGSKVTGKHEGGFRNFTGKFEVSGDELTPSGTHLVRIDMGSIWTDNEDLTEHLAGEDFFHVDRYKLATFELDRATKKEAEAAGSDDQSADAGKAVGNHYELSGTLDLHGVTKSITFPATVTGDADRIEVTANFSLNRKDFGIDYPGRADDLIRDNVVVRFNIAAEPGEPRDLVTMSEAPAPGEGRGERGQRGEGRGRGDRGEGGERRQFDPIEMKARIMERVEQRFDRSDLDGDGRITREEYESGKDADREEAKQMMAEWGRDFNEERFEEHFEGRWERMASTDEDGDGVSVTEIEAGIDQMFKDRAEGGGSRRGGPGGPGGGRGSGGPGGGGGGGGGGARGAGGPSAPSAPSGGGTNDGFQL